VRAAPTISSVSPTDNATGVAITANPAATFSENIAFGTGTVVLRANDGGWADLEVFDVEVDIGGGAGTVSIAGAVLTIEPTADLVNELEYAVRIAVDAITDISGTAFAGIADDTTWSFTTEAADTTAPVLSSPTDAANGATAATGSVSTDEGNGTLYAVCTTSATGQTWPRQCWGCGRVGWLTGGQRNRRADAVPGTLGPYGRNRLHHPLHA
jgi:hypothetical protein